MSTRTMTIRGVRYRVSTRPADGLLILNGPLIPGGVAMPAGTSLESPDLRQRVIAVIEAYRACCWAAGK